MAEPDKRRIVSIGDPVVSIDQTEALRDRWVTTGKVSYTIERGDAAMIGVLEFPYRDAPTRNDAMSDLAMMSSFGPDESSFTRVSVSSTSRPLRVRPSLVVTSTFS